MVDGNKPVVDFPTNKPQDNTLPFRKDLWDQAKTSYEMDRVLSPNERPTHTVLELYLDLCKRDEADIFSEETHR